MTNSEGARMLVSISAHGLGHLAQTAPVVCAIAEAYPRVALTVLTSIAEPIVRTRIPVPFRYAASTGDFGLLMRTPVEPLPAETVQRYLELHGRLEPEISRLANWMRAQRFSVVLSNVGYAAIAAASRAGIPAVAMSSINWHDVLESYFGAITDFAPVLADIDRAYRGATTFLRLEPGLAMRRFSTTLIPPIAAHGRARRDELLATVGLRDDARIVTFAFSAILPPSPPSLPAHMPADVLALGPQTWAATSPWRGFASTGMSFLDILASSDLVVGKPGYGLVTEAAAAQVPVLLLPHDTWPEAPRHLEWLRRFGTCTATPKAIGDLTFEEILAALDGMRGQQAAQAPTFGGEAEAVAELGRWIGAP